MKISWGTAIAIFYTAFAVAMVSLVVWSKGFDHALVVENYYEQDLKYQSHLDKIANSRSLPNDLFISEDKVEKSLRFQFPKEAGQASGDVVFYKPDDEGLDFSIKIQPGESGEFVVPTGNLAPGRWKVKVDWQGDGRAFFQEKIIVL